MTCLEVKELEVLPRVMVDRPRCMRCRTAIVEREDVEAMVKGELLLQYKYRNMAWATYVSKQAYVYQAYDHGMINKLVTHRRLKATVPSVTYAFCGCDTAPSEPLRLIRDNYRETYRVRYGNAVDFALLMHLPAEVVAWEQVSKLMVDVETGLVGHEGRPMLEVICDMAHDRVFVDFERMSLAEFDASFQYLHVIKPMYRGMAAATFGPTASLAVVVRDAPRAWVSWLAVATTRVVVHDDVQIPVRSFALAATRLVASMRPDMRELFASSLTTDTFLPRSASVVRITPADTVRVVDNAVVDLRPGDAFIPCGDVTVRCFDSLVVFEPGVSVELPSGSMLCSQVGPVAVWVDGDVNMRLHVSGCDRDKCVCAVVHGDAAAMAIALRTVALADHPQLCGWLRRRLDVRGREMRYMAGAVEFVVICVPVLSLVTRRPVLGELDAPDWSVVATRDCHMVGTCNMLDRSGTYVVFNHDVVFGGIELRAGTAMGLFAAGVVTAACADTSFVWYEKGGDYSIDCADSVDGYGQFADVMQTCSLGASGVFAAMKSVRAGVWPMADVLMDPLTFYRKHGVSVDLATMLSMDAKLFDLNAMDRAWVVYGEASDRSGVRQYDTIQLTLAGGQCRLRDVWARLLGFGVSCHVHTLGLRDDERLAAVLARRWAVTRNDPVLSVGTLIA